MNVDALFPSRWLKASDLHNKPALHVIEGLTVEEFDDDETKPILLLKDSKGLVLNRTNAGLIAAFLGDDTNGWTGKQIVLYPAKVDFRGKLVEAIRIREPRRVAPAPIAAPAPAKPLPSLGGDDDIAF